jgi:hypothetical protein
MDENSNSNLGAVTGSKSTTGRGQTIVIIHAATYVTLLGGAPIFQWLTLSEKDPF